MYLVKKVNSLILILTTLFFISCAADMNQSAVIENSGTEKEDLSVGAGNVNFAAGSSWKLVWSDEFDYNGEPDPTKWSYDVGGHGWGNKELQYYTDNRRENARVENGNLIITCRKESWGGRDYTSARMVTKNKGDWLYGKVEVRAKLPSGKGTWPAIWMLPTDNVYGGWPLSGELDIMEHVGYEQDVVHQTIHTGSYYHKIGTQKAGKKTVPGASDSFHIYSMEWYEHKVDFFIDGDLVFTFNNEYNTSNEWPFDQRFHVILNIAFGGEWGGAMGVDDWYLPVSMEVDYVRVYEQGALEPHPVPGKIEAEEYSSAAVVQTEPCDEGGLNVGWIDAGDSMTYRVNVAESGTYEAKYRTANWGSGVLQLKSGNAVLDRVTLPLTGAYQAWADASTGNTFSLEAGEYDLVIEAVAGDWNINNFELIKIPDADYTLILSPAGVTAGSGVYAPGTQVQISYTGDGRFIRWTGDTGTVANVNGSVTTVAMNEDISLAAEVAGDKDFSLTLFPANETAGSGSYPSYSSVTISYTGDEKFLYWSGDIDCISYPTNPTTTVHMYKDNLTFTAVTDKGDETIHVEAEDYVRRSGTDIEPCFDFEGGQNVGWIEVGDWLEYEVTALGGSYAVEYRVASWNYASGLQISVNGQNSGDITFPATGDYQNWTTAEQQGKITLNEGVNTIRLTATGPGWNLNWFKLIKGANPVETYSVTLLSSDQTSGSGIYNKGTEISISYTGNGQFVRWTGDTESVANVYDALTTVVVNKNMTLTAVIGNTDVEVEAEHFTRMNGILLEDCGEGTQNIGWIDPGDWVDYQVTVPASPNGNYTIVYRAASAMDGGVINFVSNGVTLASTRVDYTGGWQVYDNKTAVVRLNPGQQTIRLYAPSGPWNLNKFTIIPGGE